MGHAAAQHSDKEAAPVQERPHCRCAHRTSAVGEVSGCLVGALGQKDMLPAKEFADLHRIQVGCKPALKRPRDPAQSLRDSSWRSACALDLPIGAFWRCFTPC